MRPKAVVGYAVTVSILASVTLLAAQEVSGVEHWVEHAGLKLYVWEKSLGSPAGKPVVVLAHGSATAGRESFDLQVPGKPSYSLMDVLAREGFDVFALDTRGFGRSTPRSRDKDRVGMILGARTVDYLKTWVSAMMLPGLDQQGEASWRFLSAAYVLWLTYP